MTHSSAEFAAPRVEPRVPMALAVHLWGHHEKPGTETTFTENVSARGARVLSVRRWQSGDRLTIALLPGGFSATARVAYCHALRGQGFALGLEFLEPSGHWVLSPSVGSENNLHG